MAYMHVFNMLKRRERSVVLTVHIQWKDKLAYSLAIHALTTHVIMIVMLDWILVDVIFKPYI